MGDRTMNHATEEEITMAYYDEAAPEVRRHIDECAACRSSFVRLQNLLDAFRADSVPERADSYGREVWARLAPRLPNRRRSWLNWWFLAPSLAALLLVAFLAGMLTQRNGAGLANISPKARERVLLIALGDHLERSQIVLAELTHAAPGTLDAGEERVAARELLNENRLYRQTAARAGDRAQTALLDDLERVLLDIANGPATLSPEDLHALQQRLQSDGLLFKVRVAGSNVLEKGQKL
jgi:hypothetical protein